MDAVEAKSEVEVAPTAFSLVRSVFVANRFVEVALVEVALTENRLVIKPFDEKKLVEVALVVVALVTERLLPTAVRKLRSPVLETENRVVDAPVLLVEPIAKSKLLARLVVEAA